jgi:hypothetical protein
MVRILGAGFEQSIDMVADALGVRIDAEKKAEHQIAVASAPIDSPVGTIEPGLVAGQRFSWHGCVDGEPVVTARVNWMMGDEALEPADAGSEVPHGWKFGPKGERFEVHVTGEPPVHLTFHGLHPESIEAGLESNPGVNATAIHCVNAIPYVCEAEPGIRTYLDLPAYCGRAHPDLIAKGGAA